VGVFIFGGNFLVGGDSANARLPESGTPAKGIPILTNWPRPNPVIPAKIRLRLGVKELLFTDAIIDGVFS
jgi:hypothetical protein